MIITADRTGSVGKLAAVLGGSSHLVSGIVHPSYKWINPTYPMSITGVITHLRFLGSSPPSTIPT